MMINQKPEFSSKDQKPSQGPGFVGLFQGTGLKAKYGTKRMPKDRSQLEEKRLKDNIPRLMN